MSNTTQDSFTLFNGEPQYQNFCRMQEFVGTQTLRPAPRAFQSHLAPGKPLVSDHAFPMGVVIVKLSANPRYGTSKEDRDNKDYENILAFQAISRQFE